MKIRSLPGAYAAIFLALVFSTASRADECGEVSPILDQIGDEYYLLLELTNTGLRDSSTVYNNVVRKLSNNQYRHGDGYRTLCIGTSQVRAETSQFDLDDISAPAINSYNEVVIEAIENYEDTDVISRQEVVIPLANEFAVIQGEDTLVTNVRHRQTGGEDRDSSTSTLREIAIEVSEVGSGIQIKHLLYINGYLAEWFVWNLK